ncbi:MAG TPA: TolC family protein [Terrimicrobiaceae bacterium]|nr:TolC family protein [Terrimicrobiaceae bacterium]
MRPITTLAASIGLALLCGTLAFRPASAQTNAPASPQPPAPGSTPAPSPTPEIGMMPTPLPMPPLPTPLPPLNLDPVPSPTPSASPTPLPDGTMPWTPPPMPTPVLPDANTLSEQLNLPLPAPTQMSEPLKPGAETDTLKESDSLAMKQKMVMADFEKSLTALIARQRNPNVADLTLNEAVQISLKQNPEILNAIQQIRLTRGQLIQVVSQAIPQIGISSGYNNQQPSLLTTGGGNSTIEIPNPSGGKPTILQLGGSNDVQNQSWNIQFQATQLVFDGGATISGIQAGSAAYDAAFFSLRATIDRIVSEVINQFYSVVLNRALIVAQEQNVALLQQQVKDQQNRYDAGTVPRFNVLQAEVALANAMPPLIQAQNAYRISLYQMVKLLGMDYPKGHPSEVPFNVVGTLGYNPRKIDTDESIRVAIARNPSLKAQRQSILANAANVNVQIAGWMPKINANAGYELTNNTGSMDLTSTLQGWFFGATGSWNIWDGGATYGLVAQAKAQLMQAKNSYDNGIRQVVLDVQQAISNLQQAKETIDSQTASVVQATEALRLSRERLDAGAGTQLDVLNAQVQLLQAQTNVLQARYDYIAAMSSYDLALSLDTQYVETFDDPLVRPLNPQALSKGESKQFQKATNPDKPQPELPRAFKGQDPVKPILDGAPSPSPTPKKKKKFLWFGGK